MRKILFAIALLLVISSAVHAQTNGGKVYAYTYEVIKDGWHTYTTEKGFTLPSSGILGFDLEVSMKKGYSCMFILKFVESVKQGNSKIALLGNWASNEGNASGFLPLDGSLTLSNGERLSFSPLQVYDNRAKQFRGNKRIGNTSFLMNLTDASSSATNLGNMDVQQKHAYIVDRLSRYNISSITIRSYRISMASASTAPTLRAMLNALRKKVGEDKSFVYTPPAKRQTPPQYTPPTQQNSVPQPSAKITHFDMEHNIRMQKFIGANIVFSCNLYNMAGRTVQASAFFYLEDGRPLMDTNRNYYTISSGQVSANTNLTPIYPASTFTNVRVFIPYSELHLPHGRYSLKAKISLFDILTGQELAQSDFVYFYWEG